MTLQKRQHNCALPLSFMHLCLLPWFCDLHFLLALCLLLEYCIVLYLDLRTTEK